MKSPRTGYHDSRKENPVNEMPSLTALPAEGPILSPGRFYPNHPGTRGLHPPGALARTLWQIDFDTTPGRFYSNHLGARGLHPSGALARTLWRTNPDKIETPPSDSAQTTRGLGGYYREPNTGVPKEMELNNHRTLKTPERTKNTATLLARTTGVLVPPRPMPVN